MSCSLKVLTGYGRLGARLLLGLPWAFLFSLVCSARTTCTCSADLSKKHRPSTSRGPEQPFPSGYEGSRTRHPPHKLLTLVTAHLHACGRCAVPPLARFRAVGAAESDVCVAGRRPSPPPVGRRPGAASELFSRCAVAARVRTRAHLGKCTPHLPLTTAVCTLTGRSVLVAMAIDAVGATV